MLKFNTLRTAVVAGLATLTLSAPVLANQDPIKVGIMLPFSGVYGALGDATRNGMKMALQEKAAELHGRKIEYIEIDTEARPERAPEIASSLLNNSKADFVIGPVHSGVAMGMLKVLRGQDTVMIVPNAGAGPVTGPLKTAKTRCSRLPRRHWPIRPAAASSDPLSGRPGSARPFHIN
jgi:branched-chain amino acid transport system substrate-binding protein